MGDSGTLFQSYNASASNAAQFNISHSYGAVTISNARGALTLNGNITGTAANASQLTSIAGDAFVRGNGGGAWGSRTYNFSGDSTQGLKSGFYDISSGTNMPTTDWYHLIASAHSNSYSGNQYEFHMATAFWDKSSFYMRSISPGAVGAWRLLLTNGNYNSYSPTLTGTGASGTWGISVTGSASSAAMLTGSAHTNGSDGWFRSAGQAGLYCETYAVGWYATQAGRIDTYNNASIYSAGNITAYSDERTKKDWLPLIDNFVEKLSKIKSGSYSRTDYEGRQVGVSAQDLQKILPESVPISDDENKTLSVAYGNAALVSAVEIAKEVVDLRARVAHLEQLISKLIES